MSAAGWYCEFVASGPEYEATRVSMAELQALLMKAARGAGVPLGHAEDVSALAGYLAAEPQLLAMAIAAMEGRLTPPRLEGTAEHAVLEHCDLLLAGPMAVDLLVAGANRVILREPDWPMLMWPYLAKARDLYGLKVSLEAGDKGVVMISVADHDGLESFGSVQPVPVELVERLEMHAAKTYVPASATSRAGAGAQISDND